MDDLWATMSEDVGLIVRAIPRFSTYVVMVHQSHRLVDGTSMNEECEAVIVVDITDRQRDGQTTCDYKTSLCTIVHRAVKIYVARASPAKNGMTDEKSDSGYGLSCAGCRDCSGDEA